MSITTSHTFIATQFSCLTKDEARLIADADQSTDENPDTAPWLGITVTQALSNADNHAFTQGNFKIERVTTQRA